MRVAVGVKVPVWSCPVVRQLTPAIALGLQTPCLARIVSWISEAHPDAVGRAIVIDVQTLRLSVVCCTDVELAWLFRRRNYRPDETAISAWSGVQAICPGVGMGLESVGWAKIVVGQKLRRHLVPC